MDFKARTGDDIFECLCCGECCQGFGGTYVTPENVTAIAAFIKADPKTFVADYCDMAGSRPLLTRGSDGACIFFHKEKQCTIHPVKPRMCREWPFIKTLLKNPENWNAMASACPGMKKDVPFQTLVPIIAHEIKKIR